MSSLHLARPLLTFGLTVHYADLWVPLVLLGLIVAAAVYFARI